ncbi:hypothetical protein E4U55_007973 [Claviceps digitariae]|nr:hypothetical protein E4U55_007973 [Claviceps digitariae]
MAECRFPVSRPEDEVRDVTMDKDSGCEKIHLGRPGRMQRCLKDLVSLAKVCRNDETQRQSHQQRQQEYAQRLNTLEHSVVIQSRPLRESITRPHAVCGLRSHGLFHPPR